MVSQERHVHTGVKKGTVLELAKWPFPNTASAGGRAAMASDSLLEFTGIVRDGKIQLLIR